MESNRFGNNQEMKDYSYVYRDGDDLTRLHSTSEDILEKIFVGREKFMDDGFSHISKNQSKFFDDFDDDCDTSEMNVNE